MPLYIGVRSLSGKRFHTDNYLYDVQLIAIDFHVVEIVVPLLFCVMRYLNMDIHLNTVIYCRTQQLCRTEATLIMAVVLDRF